MPPRKGWAAVYCRLSKEDEEKTARESESIRNQRALLLAWAAVNAKNHQKSRHRRLFLLWGTRAINAIAGCCRCQLRD